MPFRCTASILAPGWVISHEQPQPISGRRQVFLWVWGKGLYGLPPGGLTVPSASPLTSCSCPHRLCWVSAPFGVGLLVDRMGSACCLLVPPPPCLPEVKPEMPSGRSRPGSSAPGIRWGGRTCSQTQSLCSPLLGFSVDCVSETLMLFWDQTFSLYMRRQKAFSVKNLEMTFGC